MAETVAPEVIHCIRVKARGFTGIITPAGPAYTIEDGEGGNRFTFEWHPYFGPSRINPKTGDPMGGHGLFPDRSKFWPLFDRWMHGGKRVNAHGRCILAPIPPVCVVCEGRGWQREAALVNIGGQGRRKLTRRACPDCHGDGRSYSDGKIHLRSTLSDLPHDSPNV